MSQTSSRASVGPPLPNMKKDGDHILLSMYKVEEDGSSDEEDVEGYQDDDNGIMEGPDDYDTGDPITAIKVNLWRPVLESYEFFQFEVTKRLQLLSKTTEFFQFVHKHLVDEQVLIESKFPHIPDWKRRTSVIIDWKRKNNV